MVFCCAVACEDTANSKIVAYKTVAICLFIVRPRFKSMWLIGVYRPIMSREC